MTLFFLVKLVVSALAIAAISELAKHLPSLGGLIAAMPLTTLLTLIWLFVETKDFEVAHSFTVGVLWGLAPTIFFFVAAIPMLKRGVSFPLTLIASLALWAAAAFVHQKLLGV